MSEGQKFEFLAKKELTIGGWRKYNHRSVAAVEVWKQNIPFKRLNWLREPLGFCEE